MAAIAWTDVVSMFPDDSALAELPVSAQNAILAYVNTQLSRTFFGGEESPKLRLARIYWAAHSAISGGEGGSVTAGPVTMRSEGGVTEQYASGGASTSGVNGSTSYGQLFDQLMRSSPRRVGLTT